MRGALSMLATLMLCACGDVPLIDSATQQEALAVQQRLASDGLAATVSAGQQGYSISLPRAQVAEAVAALTRNPTRRMCQAEGSPGALLPSPQQEARGARAARECTLADDLESLPHVVEARVRLSPGSQALDDSTSPRAAVLVLADAPIRASDVARHVSQAVPGLLPEAVNVTVHRQPPVPSPEVQPSPNLERLGPLTLTRTSRPLAETLLAALLLGNLVTASLLLLVWHRARRR